MISFDGPLLLRNPRRSARRDTNRDDRASYERAAVRSVVAGHAPRPSLADLRDEEDARSLLKRILARSQRSPWIDSIVSALRTDIVASRRPAAVRRAG